MADDLNSWHNTLEKGITGLFPGVEKVVVSSGGRSYPEDSGLQWLIACMGSLKASEVLIEDGWGKLLVVKYEYGDMAVAAFYRDGIAPGDLSRLIGLMFAGRGQRNCIRPYIPASDVERLAGRWRRAIALIFGEKFASLLVDKALGEGNREAMTPGDLEAARAFISSALGDCLALDKVNK
ncbi:MAG TPA: hypothetical protein VMC84_08275 [Methanocella sp.]|uniref:hypothetical protein n=1 Tax=Methanocella sp. TaxID=2052833 RepID=UPI002C35376F|nr:hypothetical protein [Methanocella sp.]HTY91155.1 hypothetical protein [Methanocella sp.]